MLDEYQEFQMVISYIVTILLSWKNTFTTLL